MISNIVQPEPPKSVANTEKVGIAPIQSSSTDLHENDSTILSVVDLEPPSCRYLLNKFGHCHAYSVSPDIRIQLAEEHFFELPSDFNIPTTALHHTDTSRVFIEVASERVSKELYSKGFISSVIERELMAIASLDLHGSSCSQNVNSDHHKKNHVYGELSYPKGEIDLSELHSKSQVCQGAREFFKKDETPTFQRLKEFFQTYGVIVPTRITVGGKLFTSEEIDDTQKSHGQGSRTELEAKLKSVWHNIAGGVNGGTDTESNGLEFANKQRFILNCTGGVPELMGNPNMWVQSLENYKSWAVITINSYKFTYEYLEEPVASNVIQMLKHEEQKTDSEKPPATHQLSNVINKFTSQEFVLKNSAVPVYLKLEFCWWYNKISEYSKTGLKLLLILPIIIASGGAAISLINSEVPPCKSEKALKNDKVQRFKCKSEEVLKNANPFILQKVQKDDTINHDMFFIVTNDGYLKLKGNSLYLSPFSSERSIFSVELLTDAEIVTLRHDDLYLVYNKTNRECEFLCVEEIEKLGDNALKGWELQPIN